MADVNANIGVNIDTSDALNQLKNLQRQISQFHQSVAKSSSTAAASQRDLQKNFISSINSIQGFSAELKTVRSTAESFTDALEKNKLSMRQYFRYSASQTKTFGRNFKSEFNTIEKTAIERVKTLQTQYVKMGRDATGAMQAIAIRPTVLNMQDLGTKTAIAAQKQVIFNQLVKQGSTNLLNFGKNTQWAGRQLMVGFTIPLAVFGSMASNTFMKLEQEMIKFKKVYGDLLTNEQETQDAIDQIDRLAQAYTKYGVTVTETFRIAGDAAAAGFSGQDLQKQTEQALRLSILGQLDQQKALETTISLQNAFRLSSEELAEAINFLNAVENQSVVALDDITTAIPKVAPVIQALGGNVKDLAFFIAAMKESGVNASEGANALKSSLGRLVNPSKAASDYLRSLGINIRGIVDRNAGDLQGMIFEVGEALDTLDPLTRSRAIERMFGKFQFARMSALFDNINREGSQAARVLDLSQASIEELADSAEKELGISAASAMNKFQGAVERLNVALAPIGKLFLEIATPFVEFITKVFDGFNKLPDGVKKGVGLIITVLGGIAPIALMTFGLINNGIANMIKFLATARLGYLKMTGQAKGIGDETQYMTQEHMEAAAAAASLDQAHSNLIQRFTVEKVAVDQLRDAYSQAAAAGARFATLNAPMMTPGFSPTGYNRGGVVKVGGRGNKDTEPALLTPGEAIIPAPMVKQYGPLIEGMIAGNIPGYAKGVMLGMPKSSKGVSKHRDAAEEIYQMFLKSSYVGTPPTKYGHQISPSSGHSFPIFSLGGVYQKGNKQVFVKPVIDEKAALAEMRSNEISRKAHGLESPEQRIVVIRDPLDLSGKRRFLALESDLDPKFVNNQPMGLFNEDQYFRQLVASLLRVDKDLSGSNVFGNVVADAGPAGVFSRASGLRDYEKSLPSMEDQATINLLGIRGGAKRAFAESTLGLMAGLTPEQYHQRMLAEIQKVIPALQQTIASFQLTDPTEVGIYDDMVRRLQEGLGVDWSKFHAIHSAVKPAKPKAPTQAAPQNFASGGMVRGPGGPKDDAIPANLSNGEAVIDAATVKKNPAVISALFNKKRIKIPGYSESNGREFYSFGPDRDIEMGGDTVEVRKILNELRNVTRLIDGMDDVLYEALVRLGKALNPSNLKKMLNEDPALELLRSPLPGKGRKTGSQGAVKMHAGGEILVTNIEDLRGVVSEATMKVLTDGNATQARLFKDMVFGAPAAANKGRLTGTEFASALDSDEGKDAFMRYVAEAGNIPPDHPDLRRFAEAVRQKLLVAGSNAIDDPRFGQIIEESLQEEIYDVGRNTAQIVKDAFTEAQRYSAISSNARGAVARDLKLLPNQTFSVGDQQVESIRRTTNYLGMETPEADDILFDNATLGFIRERAIAAGNEIGTIFAITAGQAAIDAARANSPSRETVDATNSLVDGVTTTIVNAKDDVAASVEQMLSPMTDSKGRLIRRASSDPEVQADIDRRNQQPTQATTDSANIAAGRFRGYRSASREGDLEARQRAAATAVVNPEALAAASNAQLDSLQKMSTSISAVSFGLSSLTGILSAFGVDLGGIMPVISGVTGALFALSTVTAALTRAKFAEVISKRMEGINLGTLFTQLKGGEKGLKGIQNILGRVSGAFKNMFPMLSRLIIPLAIAGTLFAAFELYKAVQEEQRKKIQGLGNAAAFTADQLKNLGDKLNIKVDTVDYSTGVGVDTRKSTQEQDRAAQFLQDPDFAVDYADPIAGLEDATTDQAQRVLDSLATQLINSGIDEATINAIILALVQYAKRTDLELTFNAIKIDSDQAAADVVDSITPSIESFNEVELYPDGYGYGLGEEAKKEAEVASGAIKSALDSLNNAFKNGLISVDSYNAQVATLFDLIANSQAPGMLINYLADDLGIGEFVDQLDTLEAKTFAVKMAVANIQMTGDEEKALIDGSKALDVSAEQREAATDVINAYADALENAAASQRAANETQLAKDRQQAINDAFAEQKLALENNDIAYSALRDSGLGAADAIAAVGNAAFMEAFALAATAAERQAVIDQYKEFISMVQDSPFEQAKSFSSGGKKSPFQEAIDSLKEQRQGIKDSISAYAGLRSAGLGVAEASEIAKDSMFAAALASQKVGSKKWNELVTAIRAAKAEEEAWLSTTPEGRAEQFARVYSKVMDVFNAQEAVLEMNNKAATAVNRKLIESLEKQIEVYNRRADELQRDLEKIAEKEDEINKAYDEKTKALEKVKKLNQDIINQQKSQLSIADALSRGDVSAAASAMQDARAQSAAAQGDATSNALDAARQAQLDALTENGKTRKQIEDEIKRIKKDIADIEFGALQAARDAVDAADEALKTAKDNLQVQGQSRTEWENINTRIEASKANAALYENEVLKALENAKGLVGEWSKLQDTFTTTHVVNTVYNGTPTAITPASTTNNSAAAAAALIKLQSGGTLTNAERALLGMAPAVSAGRPPNAFASGGYISGPGTPTSDSIPALLSDGEYVIKAASVDKFGTRFLDSVNKGQLPKFRLGGMVRDGGGSSRPTPKPVGRVSADTAEKRALAAKPTPAAAATAARIAQAQQEAIAQRQRDVLSKQGGAQVSSTPEAWQPWMRPPTPSRGSLGAYSAEELAAQRQRDALYKQGGAQGFEAGFQSTMIAFGKSDVGKFLGDAYSGTSIGNMVFRGALAVLGTPSEIVGSFAKNTLDLIANPNPTSLIKLRNFIFEGSGNAFSGFLDPSQQRDSMWEQAGQTVIDNKMFGAGNPESDALVRIIAGSLNILGDPLTYVGIGAIRAGLKAARARNAAKEAVSLPVTRETIDLGRGEGYFDETAYSANAYRIGPHKPIIFEGPGQDFSKFEGPGLSVVKPTPVGLIEEALKIMPPGHSSIPDLKALMDDLKNNIPTPATQGFRDKMSASAFFNDSGFPSNGDLGGLATLISSLAGDARAAAIVSENVIKLYQIEAYNKAAKAAAATGIREVGDGIVPNINAITAFRKTPYSVTREPNGDVLVYAGGQYRPEVARPSSHWTVSGPIENHGFNTFGGPSQTIIVAGLKNLIDNNGMPYNLMTNDTFWTRNPGEPLRVSDAILVRSNPPAEHAAELSRRGIIQPGQNVPPVVFDDALKEFLYEVRPSYSEADRLRLQDFGYSVPPGREIALLENKILSQAAELLGKDREVGFLDQWTTSHRTMSEQLPNLGRELGIPGILHGDTRMAHFEYMEAGLGLNRPSLHKQLDFDSLEELRHQADKGFFKTIIKEENMGPGLAKGGLVSPKYFATGGMIKLPKREAPPPQMSKGGMVPKYFASGGIVPKYFSDGGFAKGTDTVPAMLTPGEFVMNRGAVETYAPLLNALNSGINLPMPTEFNKPLYNMPERAYAPVGGAMPLNSQLNTASSLTAQDNSVYNYSLSVNVDGTNASANDIANVVMGKIKNIQSQQVKRQGVR